jgi:serine/threonine-protein kinase PknK
VSEPDLGIPGISEATQVGQGSSGVVYRARQDAGGRTVAVKALFVSELGDEDGRRFERECRALGALAGHSHIVAIFESGMSAQGRPYLVMDYLPGGTLAQRLQREGPLSWETVAEIGVKLAGALASAHDGSVLHRDIKPENVLFSAYDEPQLVDFGIARLRAGSRSRPAVINASLAHAAPEVLAGEAAVTASDVYALASTLYALLAGHPPFARARDETFHPMLTRMLTEEPLDLGGAGVPDAMCRALGAALVKEPTERTPTARALADALQEAQRAGGVPQTAEGSAASRGAVTGTASEHCLS